MTGDCGVCSIQQLCFVVGRDRNTTLLVRHTMHCKLLAALGFVMHVVLATVVAAQWPVLGLKVV